jgi:hypothetical protein
MKSAMINKTHIEGLVYEHTLELKASGPNSKNPGTEYITGTVSVATDNDCLNVVAVHFTYVTAVTGKGNTNATFTALKNIIDGTAKNVMKDGKDSAAKVRIDSAIGLNEFYSDRNGKEELVSAKRNEGGFVHIVDTLVEDEKSRNTFECDIIITGAIRKEADAEKQIPEKVIVKGAIFDFRKALLPVEFSAVNAGAMNYFESLEASPKHPTFTRVRGRQISEVYTTTKVEESAFGDAEVKEYKNTRKDFVITWAQAEPYAWDTEETILASELVEAMTARETYLATVKQRQDEYKASKGQGAAAPTASASEFNF